MTLKVRDKILIITAATLLLAIAANTLVISQVFRKGYSAALQSKMDVIANTLRSQIEKLLELGIAVDNIEGFETQCQEILQKHREVSYVMVARLNGSILFHNDPAYHGTIIDDPHIREALTHKRQTVCIYEISGQRYYNTIVPVLDGSNNPIVAVIVGFPTAIIDNKIQELLCYSSVVALASLAVATFLLLTSLSISVTKPLSKLVATIQQIRNSSDLSKRVDIVSRDELGELAHSFNQMTEDLQKTTTSIDNLNRENTERKKAEEALRRSEERFKQVAENAGEWIWEVNAEGLYIYSNPVVEEILGYKPEEIVGKKYFYDFFAPDVKEELKEAALNAFAERKGFKGLINPNIHKNSSVVILETNGTPVVNDKGNLLGYRGADRNITERKKAEAALRKSEEQFKQAAEKLRESVSLLTATLESTTDGILVVDRESRIKSFNQQFGKLWRIPEDVLESRDDNEALSFVFKQLKKPDVFITKVKELYSNPEAESFDVLEFNDGRIFERYSKPQVIGNEIVGRVWSFRDITERKRAEEKRAQLLKELENANRELKDLVYIASHDLKTPLRGIKTLAAWLSTDYADKLGEQGREQIGLLLIRVERMYNLIEGILQYSRIGRVKENLAVINLNKLMTEIIKTLAPPANISVTVENELPTIESEPTRIAQVFQNLMSNAINYMDKPQGQIKIGCVEENGFWKFNVTDNGPGIGEKYFEKIFQIFQTLALRDDFKSTGIGLAIAKKIVGLYGGRVWVESKPEEGSTFFFTLPKQETRPGEVPGRSQMGVKNEKLKTNIACGR